MPAPEPQAEDSARCVAILEEIENHLRNIQRVLLPQLIRAAKVAGAKDAAARIVNLAALPESSPVRETRREKGYALRWVEDQVLIGPLSKADLMRRAKQAKIGRSTAYMALARHLGCGTVLEREGRLMMPERADAA